MTKSPQALEENNFTSCPLMNSTETTKLDPFLLERITSVMHFISQSTCSITCDPRFLDETKILGLTRIFYGLQIIGFYNKINTFMQRHIQTQSIKMYTHLSLKSTLSPI